MLSSIGSHGPTHYRSLLAIVWSPWLTHLSLHTLLNKGVPQELAISPLSVYTPHSLFRQSYGFKHHPDVSEFQFKSVTQTFYLRSNTSASLSP